MSRLLTKHLRSRHTQRCTQRSAASELLCWVESFWKGETSGRQEGWVSEMTSPCWFCDPLSLSPASWSERFYKGGCVAQGAAEGEREEKKPAMLWRIVGVRWKTPGSCSTHAPWVKRRPSHCEHVSTAMAPHLLKKNTLRNVSVLPLQTKQTKVINHSLYKSTSRRYENDFQHSKWKRNIEKSYMLVFLTLICMWSVISLRSNPHERLLELA